MNETREWIETISRLARQKQALRVAVCDAMAVLKVAQQPGYNARTIAGEVVSNLKLEIDAIDREDAGAAPDENDDPDFREVDDDIDF